MSSMPPPGPEPLAASTAATSSSESQAASKNASTAPASGHNTDRISYDVEPKRPVFSVEEQQAAEAGQDLSSSTGTATGKSTTDEKQAAPDRNIASSASDLVFDVEPYRPPSVSVHKSSSQNMAFDAEPRSKTVQDLGSSTTARNLAFDVELGPSTAQGLIAGIPGSKTTVAAGKPAAETIVEAPGPVLERPNGVFTNRNPSGADVTTTSSTDSQPPLVTTLVAPRSSPANGTDRQRPSITGTDSQVPASQAAASQAAAPSAHPFTNGAAGNAAPARGVTSFAGDGGSRPPSDASVDSSDDDNSRYMKTFVPTKGSIASSTGGSGAAEPLRDEQIAGGQQVAGGQTGSAKSIAPQEIAAALPSGASDSVSTGGHGQQSSSAACPVQQRTAATATSASSRGGAVESPDLPAASSDPTTASPTSSELIEGAGASPSTAAAAMATSAASQSAKRHISAVDSSSSSVEPPMKRTNKNPDAPAGEKRTVTADASTGAAQTVASSSSGKVSPSPLHPTKKSADESCTSQDAVSATPPNITGEGGEAGSASTATVQTSTATVSPDSNMPRCDPDFASRVNLDAIPEVKPLPRLSHRDVAELELALQIGQKWDHSDENTWREDWSGNLQLIDKELIMNKDQLAQDPSTKVIKVSFCDWATKNAKSEADYRPVRLLFSYVYHMQGTPPMARKLLAYSLVRPADSVQQRREHILEAVRRISYDPTVLNEDGWTTEKAATPEGASGGAYLIGRRVIWDRYEAVVIAFVHDEDLGDLWKAMWLEDLDTFDLEADELQGAIRKCEKRNALRERKAAGAGAGAGRPGRKPAASQRFAASANLTVDGIEHGIVLASSFHSNARHGILWPARILHVSEVKALGSSGSGRRSSSKNVVHAVFIAPYWNGEQVSKSRTSSGTFDTGDVNADNPFCTGPLFELETVEISQDTIKKYPCNDDEVASINIDQLRASFRFLGLPKAAFPRYLDSHRIAMAFKAFARRELVKSSADANIAGALSSLTDTHSLTVKTPLFPTAVLNLPFEYTLSKLPHPTEQSMIGADGEETTEPVLKLDIMLKAMSPPLCWATIGGDKLAGALVPSTPSSARDPLVIASPIPQFAPSNLNQGASPTGAGGTWALNNFVTDYLLHVIGDGSSQSSPLFLLGMQISGLLDRLRGTAGSLSATSSSMSERKELLKLCLNKCMVVKGHGEDLIADADLPKDLSRKTILTEWRKACERIYKRASIKFSTDGFGDGVTSVITDSRCNQHITANGSFERAVRLPAAIRGAKKAGAGSRKSLPLIYTVEDRYVDFAEKNILPKAHKRSYLKRLKNKIAALPADAKGVPLSDDSDGEGGEDTMGSRGSFTAAVVGVAAALKGVDMIIGGQCVNVFCAIRPPGHHAGRELRPMKAISNGFCLLNAAASAALYATAPRSEGGLGLKRVCVIDFDVHHGNGTQDILCSTQDSRFLYVSLHAGGAHINGYEDPGESEDGLYRHSLGTSKNEGIYPGRCGDTSPHEGVLNIPLGQKVTAAAIGQALVSQVAPAVDKFSPELIILSAGFDAHENDPLGMGGLTAEDFGHVTEVACQMAFKSCSGRVLSVLEGGYGVPCCVPQRQNLFLPAGVDPPPPPRLLDLGGDLPSSMDDQIPQEGFRQKLEKCHQEGFLEAVQSHVASLAKSNHRAPTNKCM